MLNNHYYHQPVASFAWQMLSKLVQLLQCDWVHPKFCIIILGWPTIESLCRAKASLFPLISVQWLLLASSGLGIELFPVLPDEAAGSAMADLTFCGIQPCPICGSHTRLNSIYVSGSLTSDILFFYCYSVFPVLSVPYSQDCAPWLTGNQNCWSFSE